MEVSKAEACPELRFPDAEPSKRSQRNRLGLDSAALVKIEAPH